MNVIPFIYHYKEDNYHIFLSDGFGSILFESLIFPTCLDLRFFHRKTFLKRHWCTLYDHLRMLLPFGRYFQTNCCIMCRKNIFDKQILYMYDSLKTGHFLLKTTSETMILSFLEFLHSYSLSHTVTHICIHIKNLAKDNDIENGTR